MTEKSSEKESVGGTEGGSAWLEVFEVLYSPIKAFKKIVEKPQFKGPLLIFVIVIILTAVGQYVHASKLFLETDVPGETVPLIAADGFAGLIAGILASTGVTFFLQWIVYTGILLLIVKVFGGETTSWSAFFVVVGYIFAALIIYLIVNTILVSLLPTVTLPLKTLPSTPEEAQAADAAIRQSWGRILAYQVGPYINYGVNVWIAALSAVAVYTSHKLTWGKALIIAAIAAVVNFFLIFLIG